MAMFNTNNQINHKLLFHLLKELNYYLKALHCLLLLNDHL